VFGYFLAIGVFKMGQVLLVLRVEKGRNLPRDSLAILKIVGQEWGR
jgi:hypothetical protein